MTILPTKEKLLRVADVLARMRVSRSAWYLGVQHGKYPKPIKLGARTAVWKESAIDALIDSLSN